MGRVLKTEEENFMHRENSRNFQNPILIPIVQLIIDNLRLDRKFSEARKGTTYKDFK